MNNEFKDNVKVNIDDIPELDLDVLDDIVSEAVSSEVLSEEITAETSEATAAVEAPEEIFEPSVSFNDGLQEEPSETPLPEIDMEVIDFIFDETDKQVQLFEEEEFDADTLSIFDRDEASAQLDEFDDDDEDLVFVDAISVRDRRKINKIHMNERPAYEEVDQMKTRRRSHDESEVKKERSIAFAKKNIVFIGIGILVLVIIIGAISVGVRKFKETHSGVPTVSTDSEAYQVADQEAINALMTDYFTALADHDTYVLKESVSPAYDNELAYNSIVSDYVDAYENIACYAKEGLEEDDYLVAVYYEMKYSKVRATAPGMQFFYVEKNQDGDLYINNIYSQHNLTYRESETDPSIENLISSYRGEADMVSLIDQVQSGYDEAISSNDNLKEMIEVTIPAALEDWYASMEEYLNVQDEEVVVPDGDNEPVTQPEDEPATQPEDTGVSEASGTVYATDLINIRQSPSTDSEVLASATFGSDLKRIGVTEDGWTKIKTGDVTGYVKSEFVSESKPSPKEGVVITLKESLNLRAGKDEGAELVDTVPAGISVKVLEPDSNGWTKVDYNGKTGYIRSDLLTAN